MTDGDDTYPAEDARKLADQILQGKADMVIGDRLSSTYFTENKRPFHNTGNRLVRGLINLIFKSNIKDIMTGARAFNYEFVKSFPILSTGFEIETEMSIHALDKNFKLVEIPVGYRDRPEGSVSKLNTFSDGFKCYARSRDSSGITSHLRSLDGWDSFVLRLQRHFSRRCSAAIWQPAWCRSSRL